MKHKSEIRQLLLVLFLAAALAGCEGAPNESPRAASVKEVSLGNAEHGRQLFMGYAHFENEGPPCMGCHSVGDNGILGGGALGPNLTNVTTEKTDDDIISVLSNTGIVISPVMLPIYRDDPLTPQEQADLLAFMKASVGERETNKEWLVFAISVAGTLGAALALGIVYRHRLRSVRRIMVEKAEKELR